MKLPQAEHPGCYNREPYRDSYPVRDGLLYTMNADGSGVASYRIKTIPFVGTKECHSNETRCGGCKWLNDSQPERSIK